MSKRPTTIKVDASSVQGEGAYIIFKRLTWGERREYLKKYVAMKPKETVETSRQFLLEHLVSWNWVDENGAPIPLPKNEEDECALYDDEANFLYQVCGDALAGKLAMSEADLKN